MSCSVCGRGACSASFHSPEAQRRAEEKTVTVGEIEDYVSEIADLRTSLSALAERVERAEVLLKECGEYARKTSFCQEDDGWQLRAKESADFADRISSFLHDGTKGEGK